MISFVLHTLQYQVFSMSEFKFCYNYVYETPFRRIQATFDGAESRSACTEYENVIFRQISNPVVQLQLNLNIDTQQTSFALFFYIFTNVQIQNSVINLNLLNGSDKNVSLLVRTSPEFNIDIFSTTYNVQTDSSSFKNIYGISRELDHQLTLKQTSFTFTSSSSGITNFYGLCYEAERVLIENCSFNLNINASIAVGMLYISTGVIQLLNITMKGQLSGVNTYGFIYNAKAQVTFNLIQYYLKTSGSTQNCGFIQVTSDLASISTAQINFYGFSFNPSELTSYGPGLNCPCIQGALLTQGLCECKIGSSLVGNVCQCTNGAIRSGENCICTAGATMVNGVCVCTSGASLIGGICVCTSGATLSGGICVCVANALLISGICVCQPAYSQLQSGTSVCTPQYSVMSGNICICTPTYSSMIGGLCKCTPTTSFMNSGVCSCPVNSLISASACVCQPVYSSMQGGVCVCTPSYSVMSGSTCSCTPQYTTMISGICKCPTGASLVGGVCTCTAGATMSSGACVCTTGATLIGGICVCMAGAVLSGNVCQCTTPGSSLSGSKCVCTQDYTPWWAWNGGNYWCSNINACCSTEDAGPHFICSNGNTYTSSDDCTRVGYVT
ncbi:Conserved_hypothetical protein [Hexamita inflata]|uniref:Uncharacterized protein n=1 Tax=Hexamita inflata TaxID=28002 RepID=A0AA86TWX0_9EUKA|nr:Conserved hypothetical protein [Hexamita inflata]